jgi:hypothetical protein
MRSESSGIVIPVAKPTTATLMMIATMDRVLLDMCCVNCALPSPLLARYFSSMFQLMKSNLIYQHVLSKRLTINFSEVLKLRDET